MSKLWNAMGNIPDTRTENGALAYSTSDSALVDLLALAGAARNTPLSNKISLFSKAFAENADYATRLLYFLRDIRGGAGEREFFREVLKGIAAKTASEILDNTAAHISEFGRWDDVIDLWLATGNQQLLYTIVAQLREDMYSEHPSLLGKWLPSNNTSSKETRRKAGILAKRLGLTPMQYRRLTSRLRKRIGIVESVLSNKDFDKVVYEHVPSKAMHKYFKAFWRNDAERFEKYLGSVEKGEAKINTATLMPYELVKGCREPYRYYGRSGSGIDSQKRRMYNTMWEDMISKVSFDSNTICVCDTSGSMTSEGKSGVFPIDVAISLSIFFAETNKGSFHNKFITFSGYPSLQEVCGADLYEKVQNLNQADWEGNTNIDRVFSLILNAAKAERLSQEDMPKQIIIISDMQFDECATIHTPFGNWKDTFQKAGYTLPNIVFWNVDARNNMQTPVKVHTTGTSLISGFSQNLFSMVIDNEDMTPYTMMLKIVENPRYASITLGREAV